MKPCLDVVAGIIWQNGLYLAVERPEGFRMAGWWEFPGGKIEKGESKENAIIRELQEELGVTPLDLSSGVIWFMSTTTSLCDFTSLIFASIQVNWLRLKGNGGSGLIPLYRQF